MKFKVLISLLFIISTTFAAVHETEHIQGDHDDSTCIECIVGKTSLSPDIIDFKEEISTNLYTNIGFTLQLLSIHFKKRDNHSTAPPKIS